MGIVGSTVACSEKNTPAFEETQAMARSAATDCVSRGTAYAIKNCVGESVVVTGFITGNEENGYRVSVTNPLNSPDIGESDDFIATMKGSPDFIEGKVQVKGVIADVGYYSVAPVVAVFSIESEALSPSETRARSERQGTTNYISPERQIQMNREMGALALEEADAAIRENNEGMKDALAAKAVSHHVTNSADLRVDVYGMPDGRHIACKTVIYASGAPIVTCDGEP